MRDKPEYAWRKHEYRRRIGRDGRSKANERLKTYQKTPRGQLSLKAGSINSTAHSRHVKGRLSSTDLLAVMHRQGGDLTTPRQCAGCRISLPWQSMSWDHVFPVCAGGLNTRDNLQLLCDVCHTSKTGRDKTALSSFGSGLIKSVSAYIEDQLSLSL